MINKTSLPILKILMICLTLWSCSVSQHKLPMNSIDLPVILPEGMSRHTISIDITHNEHYENRVFNALIPSYGLTKNLETNWRGLTWLMGENDYYELGKISQDRTYNLLEFHLGSITNTETKESTVIPYFGYKNVFMIGEDIRNTASLAYRYFEDGKSSFLSLKEAIGYRLNDRSSANFGFGLSVGKFEFSTTYEKYLKNNEFSGLTNIWASTSIDLFFFNRFSGYISLSTERILRGKRMDNNISWDHFFETDLTGGIKFWW